MDQAPSLAAAVQLHQSGRLHEAEQIYRDILTRQPNDPNALNLLGSLALQTQRIGLARQCLQQAIDADPNVPDFHNNLGVTFLTEKRPREAVAIFRRAVALNPQYLEGHINLGLALMQTADAGQAEAAFRAAVAIKPNCAPAINNLTHILLKARRIDEAIAVVRAAIISDPTSGELHNRLGHLLLKAKRTQEALAAFQESARVAPASAAAHHNIGVVFKELGHLPNAEAALRRSVELKPDHAEAWNSLSIVLANEGKLADALEASQKVAALHPDSRSPYNNMGTILREMGLIEEAADAYRKAIQLDPNFAEACSNLATALARIGQIDEAITTYRKAIELKPTDPLVHSNLIFTLSFHPDYSAAAIFDEVKRWDTLHGQPVRQFIQPHRNTPEPNRPLKLAYVSSDFRGHVVGWNLLPFLRFHDHNQFEIHCYSTAIHRHDEITGQIRAQCDHWHDITTLDNRRFADQVRADAIDILVDLSLHTANNRLVAFAMEPAPVQVTYLGYAGSSGVQAMHYRLSDPHLDPTDDDFPFYSEQTIRLPRTYWCYEPGGIAPDITDLPSRQTGAITFGCLNQFVKVSRAALKLWAEILSRVPNSRLIMHAPPGKHLKSITDLFAEKSVAANRLEFLPRQPWLDYMQTFNRVDIALDPFPYNGGITTCDTLFMGVPVVTLSGQTSVGRGGRSILSNIGLPELVAPSSEKYVRIAIDLANDLARRAELRQSLRNRMKSSPLMDARRFAVDIEAAFRQMWRNWCGREPASKI